MARFAKGSLPRRANVTRNLGLCRVALVQNSVYIKGAAAVEESAGPAPWVELRDPEQRPPRGRARLFALPAISPGAEALQVGLEQRLVEEGFHKPEKRPFWPHVTVARVRHEARGSRRPAVVSEPPGPLPPELSEPRIAVRMTLYRSVLQPIGARYVPLAQVELPG